MWKHVGYMFGKGKTFLNKHMRHETQRKKLIALGTCKKYFTNLLTNFNQQQVEIGINTISRNDDNMRKHSFLVK